jgi:exosortase A
MSSVAADLRLANPWRSALPTLLLLVVGILVLYRDTAAVMVGIWWRSETFAHCWLVLPISLWLIWRQRARLAALTPHAQPWVLVPLVLVALFWLVSEVVVVNAATQFAMVTMLVLAVPAVLGFEVASTILFPLLFLFFGVPFGEFVVPTMIDWTADFTVQALQMTGVPVYREGNHFVIPSGSWSVIDECSGVRYLMASFMVGALFAYLNYRSYRRRALFMLMSLVVPVVANWLRAYMIVMLAHLSGNKIATGVDHVLYGWVFFGVIIFLMFVIGSRWSEPDDAVAESSSASRLSAVRAYAARPLIATALFGLAIAALPHVVLSILEGKEGAAAEARLELPSRLSEGWSAEGARLVPWTPKFANPSVLVSQAYRGQAGTVGLHVAYYRGQDEDRKLVNSQNVLIGMRDREWNVVAEGERDVRVGPQSIGVRTAEMLGKANVGASRRSHPVIWRLYWVDGRFIRGAVATKLAVGLSRLMGRGDEGAALVLYADEETVSASNAALDSFVQTNIGELDQLLKRTREAR